jgi:hypothetical protein
MTRTGLLLAAALTAASARADDPPPAPAPSPPAPDASCAAFDVEYALAANVALSDTMMGAGDGVHKIGPGKLVLRFDGPQAGALAGHVRMVVYDMRDGFTVVAKTLFWQTSLKNNTHTTATPDAAGTIAEGTLGERTLRWTTPVNGLRTDGTVTCEGSFCGKFGAPDEGTTEMHYPPHPVTFNAFEFDADKKTFTMAYAVVSRSENPRQTSKVTFAGREVRRTCVPR